MVEGAVEGYGLGGGGAAGVMRWGGFISGGCREVGRGMIWRRGVRRNRDAVGGQRNEEEQEDDQEDKGSDEEGFSLVEWLLYCNIFGKGCFFVWAVGAGNSFVSRSPRREYS